MSCTCKKHIDMYDNLTMIWNGVSSRDTYFFSFFFFSTKQKKVSNRGREKSFSTQLQNAEKKRAMKKNIPFIHNWVRSSFKRYWVIPYKSFVFLSQKISSRLFYSVLVMCVHEIEFNMKHYMIQFIISRGQQSLLAVF